MSEQVALRRLPQVQRLLEHSGPLCDQHGRAAVVKKARLVLEECRRAIVAGEAPPDEQQILHRIHLLLSANDAAALRRVINATGIVLHTNLGRAPLAAEAVAAVVEIAAGYCNLEYDLAASSRGSRTAEIEPLLADVAGAEAALAVNNGAAAILLALSAHAAGGEVIVSRGELVEIGGGFRVPEVIAQGGAKLVEVGATNKTRVGDYRAAIRPETSALLKVHQSNFRMIGFTQEVSVAELASLAAEQGLKLIVDLGSGLLAPLQGSSEPTIAETLAAGADLVTCSGDKLLGGPQAGLILGKAEAIAPLRRHPLLRAVRLDKMALAALAATLRLHREKPQAVPVRRMLGQNEAELEARAERLRSLLHIGDIVATMGFAGGGSLPEEQRASRALAISPAIGVDALARALRGGVPAVVGRIEAGRLLLDMLAVANEEIEPLAAAVARALG